DVSETTTALAAAPEEVGQVEGDAAAVATARHAEAAGAEQRPCLVVLPALGLVGQHVVGLGDLLELLLGRGVALVRVRVMLARELAIGLFDLGLARVLRDTEGLVVVLLDVVPRAQLSAPPSSSAAVSAGSCTATRAGRRIPSPTR